MRRSKAALLRRLRQCKAVLRTEYRKRFSQEILDRENLRMISDDGKLRLQWRLRDKPGEPESYENQQSTVGSVSLEYNET